MDNLFLPVIKIPKRKFKFKFYRVDIQPPIARDLSNYIEEKERLLRRFIRKNKLLGFTSGDYIGLIIIDNNDFSIIDGEHSIIYNKRNYQLKLREEPKKPRYRDYEKGIRSILENKFDRGDKGFIYERSSKGMLEIRENFNIQVSHDNEYLYLILLRRVEYELDIDLNDIIRRIGYQKTKNVLIGRKIKTKHTYKFSKYSGDIDNILFKYDREYDRYYKQIKNHYEDSGKVFPDKFNWFKKQKYGTPIIITRNMYRKNRYWLATALTLQMHPSNYDIIKDISPEAYEELKKRSYPNAEDLFKFFKNVTNKLIEVIRFLDPQEISLKNSSKIMRSWEYKILNKPKLKFGKGIDDNAKSISNYGPVDFSSRRFEKLFIVTSYYCDQQIDYLVEDLVFELTEKLKNFFKLKVKYDIGCYNYKEAINKAKEYINKGEDWRAIILQILEEKDSRPESPYAKLRKLAFAERIPVQTILRRTLLKKENLTVISNNIALAIYAKVGGRPWALAETASRIFKNAIYIGYDVSGRSVGRRTGTAIIYDSMGQVILHNKRELPTIGQSDIVAPDHLKAFIKEVIEDALEKLNKLDVIVIHKDGEIRLAEINALKDAIKEIGRRIHIIILSFPKNAPFIFKVANNSIQNVEDGTVIYAGTQIVDEYPRRVYFLQSRTPWGTKAKPVSLLKYRIVYIGFFDGEKLEQKSLDKELEEDIARQVYYLTKLNWSTLKGESKAPVTVHFAHKLSNILSYGISLGTLDPQMLPML